MFYLFVFHLDTKKYLSDKLKFLANIHHTVYDVGIRKPDVRLDLKAVQDQIDNARMSINLNDSDKQMSGAKTKSKKNVFLPNSLWWPVGEQG